jgi:hypothetical protein
MSNYFFKRIKNLPTTTSNNNHFSGATPQIQTIVKTIPGDGLSDDELLANALKFEQTTEFKQAEEEAKQARGE